MKLRAAGQLQYYLDRQLKWRKRELTSLKFCVGKALAADQPVLLRAAVGLLYAHWEGFIKDGAVAYVEHAGAQALTLGQLRPHFRAIALRPHFDECARRRDLSIRREFVELLDSGLEQQAKIAARGTIRTRANLRTEVLREIIAGLGLDHRPFSMKGKTVIDRLVRMRNEVMHGRGTPVDVSEYGRLHDEVVLLIDEFKNSTRRRRGWENVCSLGIATCGTNGEEAH